MSCIVCFVALHNKLAIWGCGFVYNNALDWPYECAPHPQTQEVGKQQKVKKKKVKKVTTATAMSGGVVVGGGGGEKHWNDLFTLPEREGMVGEAAAVDST